KLQDKTDMIVLLSHLGIYEDRTIAKEFPEIDVIIGGHTHHLLEQGEYVGQTLLAAAGKFCTHVGEVQLVWDHRQNKLSHCKAETTATESLPKDFETKERLEELSLEATAILSKPIIYSKEELTVDWFKETE